MTPDVVVDIGNSRIKWGLCEAGKVVEMVSLAHDDPVGWKRQAAEWRLGPTPQVAIAGVAPTAQRRFDQWLRPRVGQCIVITHEIFLVYALALETLVEEPLLIGIDRLLASLAAYHQTPDGHSSVILNVGTAMTIDFVKSGGHHVGGAILPGPRLMAKSLHDYTAKLPFIEPDLVLPVKIWGANTESAIELGIANAILGVADQMVWDWAAAEPKLPWVFATGGDVGYFRGFAFTADVGQVILDPHLTLEGIRLVAEALP